MPMLWTFFMSFAQITSPLTLPHGILGFFVKTESEQLTLEKLSVSDFELPPSLQNAVPKRQNEYLIGRFCARIALESAGCQHPPLLPHTTGQAPTWPAGFTGSITHTAGLIGAIVASSDKFRALGLDAEALMDPTRATKLRDSILTPDEISREAEHAKKLGWSHAQLVSAVFSAKEAIYKAHSAVHPDRNRFHDVEVDFTPGAFTFKWASAHEQKYKTEAHLAMTPSHVVSLVTVLL
jgi:enterobactin synthetase component D